MGCEMMGEKSLFLGRSKQVISYSKTVFETKTFFSSFVVVILKDCVKHFFFFFFLISNLMFYTLSITSVVISGQTIFGNLK